MTNTNAYKLCTYGNGCFCRYWELLEIKSEFTMHRKTNGKRPHLSISCTTLCFFVQKYIAGMAEEAKHFYSNFGVSMGKVNFLYYHGDFFPRTECGLGV